MIYWLKNIFGLGIALTGIFLVLFFSSDNFKEYPFLIKHHQVIGASLLPLGALIVSGLNNLIKTIIGLVICLIGIWAFSYFMDKREGWIGQIITNFIAPATILGGCVSMLFFDNDLNRKGKR